MTLNNIFRESQKKLITLLGYDPNYFKIKQIEEKIKENCFPHIDLNYFSCLTTCFRLINLKQRNYLTNLPIIINEIISRLEFIGYKFNSKIFSKIVETDERLILEIYEQEEDEIDIIYRIKLCKKINQKMRWIYQSANINDDITEIDKLLLFDYSLQIKGGIDKSEEISFSIIIGIINELLAYLDIPCSVVRVNLSEFLYIYEGQEDLAIMPYLQQFSPEIVLFDLDTINSYINEVRINTELKEQCAWEVFHFFIN